MHIISGIQSHLTPLFSLNIILDILFNVFIIWREQ
jgi:hypothetical protein